MHSIQAMLNGKKRNASPTQEPPGKRRRGEEAAPKDSSLEHPSEDPPIIVDREFYPPEMSNERCAQYMSNEIERPMETLHRAQRETREERDSIEVDRAVVHWFKCDLRTYDNKALHLASKLAKSHGVPLICLHMISPQDYKAHMTSPARVDFVLRTLEVLKEDLAKLNIPLYVETVEKRKAIPNRILELCDQWGANHLFCNLEYEVDELRREALITRTGLKRGISLTAVHDTCVVAPGELKNGTGGQYTVYSPWYRAWMAHIHAHPHQLDLFDPPSANPPSTHQDHASIFSTPIPLAPPNKSLVPSEKSRFRSLWPAGEHSAHARLTRFLAEKVPDYQKTRNFPAANSTAVLSVHFASGTLSARTAVSRALALLTTTTTTTTTTKNPPTTPSFSKFVDGNDNNNNQGIRAWISELAWRDFYKHVLARNPHICMSKPLYPQPAHSSNSNSNNNIRRETETEKTTCTSPRLFFFFFFFFDLWRRGRTGFPFIDAGMRQLNATGYMHNRARMAVASFLANDLLLDWRLGERYFMEHLIDGDFASNNGGWAFCAGSSGVFRVFNPCRQGERFDAEGEYIRKWVPELAGVEGKAVHDPYERGAGREAERAGYPRACVQHKASRERALQRYKEGLKES